MECTAGSNLKNCTCTYSACSRRGKCCECVMYHRRNGELPGCFFSREGEATYDRSVDAFLNDRSRR